MDEVVRLAAEGAPEGTTVLAELQTAGRGRQDRRWEAPPETAVLMSVLLRPRLVPALLSPLSLLTADAIAQALDDLHDCSAAIKWPNDVLAGGRKIAGVLIQTRFAPGGDAPVVIVGIGINANIPSAALPRGATSLLALLGRVVDREALREAVVVRLTERYDALLRDDLNAPWSDVERRLAMRGEPVTLRDGARTLAGTVVGVDRTGALLLDTGEPEPRRVVAGELTRGPWPAAS